MLSHNSNQAAAQKSSDESKSIASSSRLGTKKHSLAPSPQKRGGPSN